MPRNIVIDTSQLNSLVQKMQQLPESEIPKAYTAALNRTLDHVYTKTGRYVKDNYRIKASEIKPFMKKHKATFSRRKAWIQIRSQRLTLGRFVSKGKSKYVKAKVKKTSKFRRVGGTPPAFKQQINGNTQVLRRLGKNRYPIEVLRTISPTQMVENLNVAEKIQQEANQMLAKRIEHEVSRRLKKVKI
jgi:hypothetical protein